VRFLFLPTGLEIKTPGRSEQQPWLLPALTSPTDPIAAPWGCSLEWSGFGEAEQS